MYSEHQPLISKFAQSSPEGLARVIQFALLSARVKFFNMPSDFDAALQGDPGTLYGHKGPGFNLAWVDREANYWNALDAYNHAWNDQDRANRLLLYFAGLPALGVVKAGFVSQMAFGLSGCIDTHNVKRFGVCQKTIRNWQNFNQKSPTVRRRYVDAYNAVIDAQGGTATLWDGWCTYLHTLNPKAYNSPDEVSAIHLCILDQPLEE